MWLYVTASVLVPILLIAIGRAMVARHKARQNRSMRDHLMRISSGSE
jgi:hypothetical protein